MALDIFSFVYRRDWGESNYNKFSFVELSKIGVREYKRSMIEIRLARNKIFTSLSMSTHYKNLDIKFCFS